MTMVSQRYSIVLIVLSFMVVIGLSESPIRIKYMMMEGHQFDDSKISDAFFVALERSIDTIVNFISVDSVAPIEEVCMSCDTLKGVYMTLEADLFIQIRLSVDCSSGVAASASTCCRGKMDRPTAGIIWLCPLMIDNIRFAMTGDKRDERFVEMLLIHELIHIMAFNPQSLNYFRHPDGTPRVLRDSTGNPLGSLVQGSYLTTPSVQSFVREHFECPTLNGALLDTVKAHWDQALFTTEVMTPVLENTIFLSFLTLALLNDSGWYQVSFPAAKPLLWGKGWGCEIAQTACDNQHHTQHFCDDKLQAWPNTEPPGSLGQSCSFERAGVGKCGTGMCPVVSAVKYCSDYEGDITHGEVTGSRSLCMQSTLLHKRYKVDPNVGMMAYCYGFRCSAGTQTPEIKVMDMNGNSEWYECHEDFTLELDGYTGYIICPQELCKNVPSLSYHLVPMFVMVYLCIFLLFISNVYLRGV